ncbi:MAG: hypothetical protein JXA90_15735 [Planctomycetes bacterium]|nr:hypothetical protein [Planctomycetota bacterium]
MKVSGLLGAVIGGVLGMAAWAALAALAHYETGILAWAIGGAVGFGAVLLGGRGTAMAMAAGIIALASIFAGKVAANHFLITHESSKLLAGITSDVHEEALADAEAFSRLVSGDEHRAFMVARGFTAAQDPAQVTRAELEEFRSLNVPILEKVHAESPDLEGYRRIVAGHAFGDLSPFQLALEDLNFIDVIFALLGIGTAYGLVMKAGPAAEKEDEAAGAEQAYTGA